MGLKQYNAKRNFRKTREPAGERKVTGGVQPDFFVVQKHDATRLHYDFRLAMEGVLKSWAVPKGFPAKRGDRRLAVQVEDHPMSYAGFEGTIPEGNYGAGTVMVWDVGTFEVSGGNPPRALREGKLHLTLKGKKLKGEWTLVRMRPHDGDDRPQWLLFKTGDDVRPVSARADDESVLSKRTLKQIASDNDAQWESNRQVRGSRLAARVRERMVSMSGNRASSRTGSDSKRPRAKASLQRPELEINLPRLPKRKPAFVEPMKAALVRHLPKGDDWTYEVKFDGVRALAIKDGKKIELLSRNTRSFTARFPELVSALRELPCSQAVLDGEIVALDPAGRSSFQLLQAHQMPGGENTPIFFYVFDLVQLDGQDVTGLPLLKRKATAQSLITKLPGVIRFSSGIQGESERVQAEMKARGLEGMIAKRKDSAYEIGRRSGAWVKYKWTNEQEFVIGGFTEPRGTRTCFGAILVGYYEGGKLLFASKVGTGFDERLLKSLHETFRNLARKDCPFDNLPEPSGRFGRGLTRAEMRRCTWIEPKLVCQIRFAEWTRDGHLRQPSFLGLREDKSPKEVVREQERRPSVRK